MRAIADLGQVGLRLLLQEPASYLDFGAELVVEGIVEGEKVTELGRQGLLEVRVEKRFLILLLRFVAAAVERVRGGPRTRRAIFGPPVPQVRS